MESLPPLALSLGQLFQASVYIEITATHKLAKQEKRSACLLAERTRSAAAIPTSAMSGARFALSAPTGGRVGIVTEQCHLTQRRHALGKLRQHVG